MLPCFGILLTSSFSYSILKTFVLSDAIQAVKATTTDSKAAEQAAATATTTDTSYSDDNIQVSLTEKTVENTQVTLQILRISSSGLSQDGSSPKYLWNKRDS